MAARAGATTFSRIEHECANLPGGIVATAIRQILDQSVEFTPATTTVGSRICPPEVLRAYDRSANQVAFRLKRSYAGGEPSLKIDSEVLYFQGKGLLSGALLLARVQMHAGDELVGDALVKTESNSFRAGGEGDLAQASLDALARFLEKPQRTAPPRDAAEKPRDAHE